METAITRGYRLVDTAAAYNNENEVGDAVARSGVAREDLFITTKLWISDYGYELALKAFQTGADKLGLDYLDLYLLHQPVPTSFDDTVAAYRALETLLADGRVRAIGVSNFNEQHLTDLRAQTTVVPAVNQVEVHPFFTQEHLRQVHANLGVVTQAWSPIGGVNVYWKNAAETAGSPLQHPTVRAIATRHDKTPAQVILRWHLQHDMCAIPKSVRPDRITENIDLFDFELSGEDMSLIDRLDTGVRGGPDPDSIHRQPVPGT